jgi:glutathione S-transferase
MITLHGSPGSPFVRKVQVVLLEKGLEYTLDPVMPFGPNPEFRRISPLGKIPALTDDGRSLPDSSVICAYLERKYPERPIYPIDPWEYGRALWFEEFADSALVSVTGPKIFFQKVVNPMFFNRPADEEMVEKALHEELPPLLDYLESEAGDGSGFVGGRFSFADVAVATQFVNFHHAGYAIDAQRWPKLAALVDRTLARPSFAKCIEDERAIFPR